MLIVTQSLALAVVALGYGFTLAIQERLQTLREKRLPHTLNFNAHWVSDGGSLEHHQR